VVWGLDSRRYPEGLVLVSIQNPVRIGDYDEPEPDVALLQPRADDYGGCQKQRFQCGRTILAG